MFLKYLRSPCCNFNQFSFICGSIHVKSTSVGNHTLSISPYIWIDCAMDCINMVFQIVASNSYYQVSYRPWKFRSLPWQLRCHTHFYSLFKGMCGILHIHPVEYILPDDQESALKSNVSWIFSKLLYIISYKTTPIKKQCAYGSNCPKFVFWKVVYPYSHVTYSQNGVFLQS